MNSRYVIRNIKSSVFYENHCDFLSHLHRQAMDGYIISKKSTALLIVTLTKLVLQKPLMMKMNWIIWLINSEMMKSLLS